MNSFAVARRLRRVVGRSGEMRLRASASRIIPVRHYSHLDGAYHCAPWKAGSQVVRAVLFDPEIYRATGLEADHVEGSHAGISRPRPRPTRHLSSVLYATTIQLSDLDPDWRVRNTAVLAVVREPNALLRSWYRSNLSTHDPNADVLRRRSALAGLTAEEGLLMSVDDEFGTLLRIMASWCLEAQSNSNVLVVPFEKVMGGEIATWSGVMQHLGAQVNERVLQRVLNRYHVGNAESLRGVSAKYALSGRSRSDLPGSVEEKMRDMFGHLLVDIPYGSDQPQ